MLFNTYEFIFIYLPLVFFGFFWLAKHKGQKASAAYLVIASLCFYGYWDARYVPLLLLSIFFNFCIGRQIEHSKAKKKSWLLAGIAGNLTLLGYYKYMGFFIATLNSLTGFNNDIPTIILPLGISFFTFTQTAYLIDAYRGETKGSSIINYMLFVTIFPHLIAGPIINWRDMLPQFLAKENYKLNYDNIARGLMFFIIGLFKKVVIADTIAVGVNRAYGVADALSFYDAWFAAVGYTLQLYFDFSGYSEMAVGLALLFNIKLPFNFNSPYKSCSIIDFWRRWHMTLGAWVKNYLYIPLGGNRLGEVRKSFNLFVSMLLIGLWHGAGWTFVAWGALHGAFLLINHQWRRLGLALPKALAWLLTFLTVNFLWVLFRSPDFATAMQIISTMLDFNNIGSFSRSHGAWGTRGIFNMTVIAFILVLIMPNTQTIVGRFRPRKRYLALAVVLMFTTMYYLSQISDFLYFQF